MTKMVINDIRENEVKTITYTKMNQTKAKHTDKILTIKKKKNKYVRKESEEHLCNFRL